MGEASAPGGLGAELGPRFPLRGRGQKVEGCERGLVRVEAGPCGWVSGFELGGIRILMERFWSSGGLC